MSDRLDKILCTIGILLFFAFVCFVIYMAYDFANDYRCSNMPINEFFQDEKCEKYWRYREDEQ